MTTKTTNKLFAAAVLGTIAFNSGIKRIPAMDKSLMPLLASNEIGEGIPVLEAWLHAWDLANLAKQID